VNTSVAAPEPCSSWLPGGFRAEARMRGGAKRSALNAPGNSEYGNALERQAVTTRPPLVGGCDETGAKRMRRGDKAAVAALSVHSDVVE
jgi:hypothetical protein